MTRNSRSMTLLAAPLALLVSAGCASAPPKPQTMTSDGLPTWVRNPCVGQQPGTVCAYGASEMVGASMEAGKVDAEMAALNGLQAQVEIDLGRLIERFNQTAREISGGRFYGQQTLNDTNRVFSEKTLRGARFVDYFYDPSPRNPKTLFVLAIVNPDTAKLSEDIMQSLLATGASQRLFANAQEAQARFDKVRRQEIAVMAAKIAIANKYAPGQAAATPTTPVPIPDSAPPQVMVPGEAGQAGMSAQ